MIGGRGAGIRLLSAIDVCRDGLLKDVEPVQLVDGTANFSQRLAKGVICAILSVLREEWVHNALEESVAGVGCVENLDRGNGHRCGGVQRYELMLATLGLCSRVVDAFAELFLPLLKHLRVYRLAELLKDLIHD